MLTSIPCFTHEWLTIRENVSVSKVIRVARVSVLKYLLASFIPALDFSRY